MASHSFFDPCVRRGALDGFIVNFAVKVMAFAHTILGIDRNLAGGEKPKPFEALCSAAELPRERPGHVDTGHPILAVFFP
jgi:hypothetical protein